MFLLDTDHVTFLFRGASEGLRIQRRMLSLDPKEVGTTIITYEEQSRGWLSLISQAKSAAQQIESYVPGWKIISSYFACRKVHAILRAGGG